MQLKNSTRRTEAASSNLQRFASTHNLELSFDPIDYVAVIYGRHGQIYQYSKSEFALWSFADTVRESGLARHRCERAGMKITQRGDAEFCSIFAGDIREQASAAIGVIEVSASIDHVLREVEEILAVPFGERQRQRADEERSRKSYVMKAALAYKRRFRAKEKQERAKHPPKPVTREEAAKFDLIIRECGKR